MKRVFIKLVLFLLVLPVMGYPQKLQINDFEQLDLQQWKFVNTASADTGNSFIRQKIDSSLHMQGDASLCVDWSVDICEDFGGLSRLEYWLPGDSLMPWADYDTLSFWINNNVQANLTGVAELHFLAFDISDCPEGIQTWDSDSCEVYYSLHYVLDDEQGWQQIKIPLEQVSNFGETGFYWSGWSGISGNRAFDRDRIKGFALEFFCTNTGAVTPVNGQLNMDDMIVFTKRPRFDALFNGMAVSKGVELQYSGIDGSVEISEENPYSGTQSIKWTTSQSELFTGPVFQLAEPLDYIYHWQLNPLSFKLRMGEGRCDIRILITDDDTDGDGPDCPFAAEYILKKPVFNLYGTWQEFEIPLSHFNRSAGYDNGEYIEPGMMDSCRISSVRFQIADSAGLDHTFFLDDVVFGMFPDDGKPKQPQFIIAAFPENYQNLISWTDSYEGNDETYSIYFSETPINQFNYRSDEVEVAVSGLTQEDTGYRHDLIAPLYDTPVNYYYAVTVVDEYGMESDPVDCRFVESAAKGISVIPLEPGFNFSADGHLDEWTSIRPFRMYSSDGSGTVVTGTQIDDDNDLSADIHIACDRDNLYIAFNIKDDSLEFYDGSNNLWDFDSPQLYIGLYDAHNMPHKEPARGNEPDYIILFNPDGIHFMNPCCNLIEGSTMQYFFDRVENNRYCIEAKIPFISIAEYETDSLFIPAHEMRIPLDISINDRDGGDQREGILIYSRQNDDESWRDVGHWSHTWIWENATAIRNNRRLVPENTTLRQNYPNPFNPCTQINFYLPQAGYIKIKVFNINGEQVCTLAEGYYNAGESGVMFDGSKLASGFYFYRLYTTDHVETKKMLMIQ